MVLNHEQRKDEYPKDSAQVPQLAHDSWKESLKELRIYNRPEQTALYIGQGIGNVCVNMDARSAL